MSEFVQPLELRQLLSASVNLAVDEAKVGLDVTGIIADAKSARTTLVADGKAVAGQLRSLKLANTALGKSLAASVASSRAKVGVDVRKIISAGTTDGTAVFNDWKRIEFKDSGDATALAADQVKLAVDVKKLWAVESPFIAKLQADILSAETKVGAAVQKIVTANKGNATLTAKWTAFETAFQSQQTIVTDDFTQLTTDVNQLIADL